MSFSSGSFVDTISVDIRGSDNLTPVLRAASDSMTVFLGSTERSISALGRLGAQAAPVVALGAAFRGAVTDAAALQQQVANLNAVLAATPGQLQAVQNAVLKQSQQTQFTSGQILPADYQLAKAGLTPQQLADPNGVSRNVLNLASATQSTPQQAATAYVTVARQFNVPPSQASQLTTTLAQATDASTGNLGQLTAGYKQVGTVGQAAGYSDRDTATAIAALSEAGFQGDAGTSLKTFVQRLQHQTPAARNAMQDIGFNPYDQNGNLLSLPTVFNKLQSSTAGLTNENRDSELYQIFGARGTRVADYASEFGAQGINDVSDKMKSLGSDSDIANAKLNTLDGSAAKLGSSMNVLSVQFGQALVPGMRAAADQATTVANALTSLNQAVPLIPQTLAGGAAVGGELLAGRAVMGLMQQRSAAQRQQTLAAQESAYRRANSFSDLGNNYFQGHADISFGLMDSQNDRYRAGIQAGQGYQDSIDAMKQRRGESTLRVGEDKTLAASGSAQADALAGLEREKELTQQLSAARIEANQQGQAMGVVDPTLRARIAGYEAELDALNNLSAGEARLVALKNEAVNAGNREVMQARASAELKVAVGTRALQAIDASGVDNISPNIDPDLRAARLDAIASARAQAKNDISSGKNTLKYLDNSGDIVGFQAQQQVRENLGSDTPGLDFFRPTVGPARDPQTGRIQPAATNARNASNQQAAVTAAANDDVINVQRGTDGKIEAGIEAENTRHEDAMDRIDAERLAREERRTEAQAASTRTTQLSKADQVLNDANRKALIAQNALDEATALKLRDLQGVAGAPPGTVMPPSVTNINAAATKGKIAGAIGGAVSAAGELVMPIMIMLTVKDLIVDPTMTAAARNLAQQVNTPFDSDTYNQMSDAQKRAYVQKQQGVAQSPFQGTQNAPWWQQAFLQAGGGIFYAGQSHDNATSNVDAAKRNDQSLATATERLPGDVNQAAAVFAGSVKNNAQNAISQEDFQLAKQQADADRRDQLTKLGASPYQINQDINGGVDHSAAKQLDDALLKQYTTDLATAKRELNDMVTYATEVDSAVSRIDTSKGFEGLAKELPAMEKAKATLAEIGADSSLLDNLIGVAKELATVYDGINSASAAYHGFQAELSQSLDFQTQMDQRLATLKKSYQMALQDRDAGVAGQGELDLIAKYPQLKQATVQQQHQLNNNIAQSLVDTGGVIPDYTKIDDATHKVIGDPVQLQATIVADQQSVAAMSAQIQLDVAKKKYDLTINPHPDLSELNAWIQAHLPHDSTINMHPSDTTSIPAAGLSYGAQQAGDNINKAIADLQAGGGPAPYTGINVPPTPRVGAVSAYDPTPPPPSDLPSAVGAFFANLPAAIANFGRSGVFVSPTPSDLAGATRSHRRAGTFQSADYNDLTVAPKADLDPLTMSLQTYRAPTVKVPLAIDDAALVQGVQRATANAFTGLFGGGAPASTSSSTTSNTTGSSGSTSVGVAAPGQRFDVSYKGISQADYMKATAGTPWADSQHYSALMKQAQAYNIDPRAIMSIAQTESSYDTAGLALSANKAGGYNDFGLGLATGTWGGDKTGLTPFTEHSASGVGNSQGDFASLDSVPQEMAVIAQLLNGPMYLNGQRNVDWAKLMGPYTNNEDDGQKANALAALDGILPGTGAVPSTDTSTGASTGIDPEAAKILQTAQAHLNEKSSTFTNDFGKVWSGWCEEFVDDVVATATGQDGQGFRFSNPDTRIKLAQAGDKDAGTIVKTPQQGDIVAWPARPGDGSDGNGHTGIYAGNGQYISALGNGIAKEAVGAGAVYLRPPGVGTSTGASSSTGTSTGTNSQGDYSYTPNPNYPTFDKPVYAGGGAYLGGLGVNLGGLDSTQSNRITSMFTQALPYAQQSAVDALAKTNPDAGEDKKTAARIGAAADLTKTFNGLAAAMAKGSSAGGDLNKALADFAKTAGPMGGLFSAELSLGAKTDALQAKMKTDDNTHATDLENDRAAASLLAMTRRAQDYQIEDARTGVTRQRTKDQWNEEDIRQTFSDILTYGTGASDNPDGFTQMMGAAQQATGRTLPADFLTGKAFSGQWNLEDEYTKFQRDQTTAQVGENQDYTTKSRTLQDADRFAQFGAQSHMNDLQNTLYFTQKDQQNSVYQRTSAEQLLAGNVKNAGSNQQAAQLAAQLSNAHDADILQKDKDKHAIDALDIQIRDQQKIDSQKAYDRQTETLALDRTHQDALKKIDDENRAKQYAYEDETKNIQRTSQAYNDFFAKHEKNVQRQQQLDDWVYEDSQTNLKRLRQSQDDSTTAAIEARDKAYTVTHQQDSEHLDSLNKQLTAMQGLDKFAEKILETYGPGVGQSFIDSLIKTLGTNTEGKGTTYAKVAAASAGIPIPGHMNGGWINSPFAMVGERGPELIAMQGAYVYNAAQTALMTSGSGSFGAYTGAPFQMHMPISIQHNGTLDAGQVWAAVAPQVRGAINSAVKLANKAGMNQRVSTGGR